MSAPVLNTPQVSQPSYLAVPGKLAQSRRVTNSTGYNSTVFAGKEAQLDAGELINCYLLRHGPNFTVMDEIDRQGFIPESLIENETKVSSLLNHCKLQF